MDMKSLILITFAFAILHLQGCSTVTPAQPEGLHGHNLVPPANPALDHYIAWIPREQASTATVARARAHVALGNAKEQAVNTLCDGAWLLDGPVIDRVGPIPVTKASSGSGSSAWYYRVSRIPGIRSCGTASEDDIYTSLVSSLPDWLSLEKADILSITGLAQGYVR